MELKEYIQIIRKNFNLFAGVTVGVVLLAFAYFIFRPVSYNASLTLNITRQGAQSTLDYKFDDFYRLQADEKFAETIVQWLQSPRTVAEIYSKAGLNTAQFTLRQLTKSFKPEKLSSQIVVVNFSAANPEATKNISNSITEIISKNTDNLNANQKENTWFAIVAQEAVIVKNNFDPIIVLVVSFAVGIFLAFWSVLIFHYIK